MDARAFATRAGAVGAVLALLVAMLHWEPPPIGRYAQQRYDIVEYGVAPASFAFYAYDADTGEFLYAIAKRDCVPATKATPVAGARDSNGGLFISWWSSAYMHWDVGPAAPPSILGDLRRSADKLYEKDCIRGYGAQSEVAGIVLAEAGHFPQFDEARRLDLMGGSLKVRGDSLGPTRFVEHRVAVLGDAFEVRVWEGIGERNATCGAVLGPGKRTSDWYYQNDPGEGMRQILMCVGYRYVGPPLLGEPEPVDGATPVTVALLTT